MNVGFPEKQCKNTATGYTISDPMLFLCDYHRGQMIPGSTVDFPQDLEIEKKQEGVNKS